MMKVLFRGRLLAFAVAAIATCCVAQNVAKGTPPFASLGGGPDVINLGNLNVRMQIPILDNPGRGLNMTYSLIYDSSIWYPSTSGSSTTWQPVSSYGWQGLSPANVGDFRYVMTVSTGVCGTSGQSTYTTWGFGSFVYTDQNGTSHNIPGGGSYTNSPGGSCPAPGAHPAGTVQSATTDGSNLTGYYTLGAGTMSFYIVNSANTTLYPSILGVSGSTAETDSNGNQITLSGGAYTDTLNNASILKIVGQAPETDISYLTPAQSYATVKVTYQQYNIHTYFQCSGINEFTAQNVYLVDKVTLPDQTFYQFQYETTNAPGFLGYSSGRISQITLPTGGTITYQYTNGNNGIECMDGSTAGFIRTVSPGGKWTYSRTPVSGSSPHGSQWTTKITDPALNDTLINFSEDSANTPGTYNLYPTQQQYYQGSSSPANLKMTSVTCYNGVFSNCANASVTTPITQRDVYTVHPNGLTRLSELAYLGSGLIQRDSEYDYGVSQGASPGTNHLIRETDITYAPVGKPSQITVNDWVSGAATQIASTTFTYDQGAVSPTSNTPQHVSVSGRRGNLTTVAQVANGTTTLYRTFSYYDTGMMNTTTDLSTSTSSPGPQTTYKYDPVASCGNSFPTEVDEPLSLKRLYSWNCSGGVQTQITDENGQTAKTNYTDSQFWRPANSFDQANNETLYTYGGQNSASSVMTFNNSQSVQGLTITVDGLGRPTLNQRPQGPSATTYDTNETDYNNLGLTSRATMPFSAGSGGTNSSAADVSISYDALGRPISVTDKNQGSVAYQYTNNDVLQTISGTQAFKKLLEYDGLGRLTSVCEISSTLPQVGACGPTGYMAGFSGYLTKYTYDALGHLLTVNQNAQPGGSLQQRIYSYDQLGRVISESNPETSNTSSNGTTTYTYDQACTTTPASAGDLTKKVDNAGQSTCYAYDALHRVTVEGWNTVCRIFNYDTSAAPPTGISVSNTKTRVLEAYTYNCGSVGYTDEWFSYSPRGEVTDVYEATPHSGGYYHTTATYWPNGTLQSLGGIATVPMLYYGASNNGGAGLDGEGRITQVVAGSGIQNPVTSVTYSSSSSANYLGALTDVTYGSSDKDSFTFDSNTGRQKSYVFTVNGQTDTGTLNWNSNGTLATLAITDSISGTTDTQNCSYTYDDIGRIGAKDSNGYSVDCGAKWQQYFTYDAFGNITKSGPGGSTSFASNYPYPNNHFTLSGGPAVSYDPDGNLTADNLNRYTWDPNWGNMTSVNGMAAVYDAFDRVVEQQSGSGYLEILYSPIGKTAIMNGSGLVKAFMPLPGGGTAIYSSAGLAYYRHPDWLGSSRLTSTAATRTMYSSSSYAPFGEQYATAGSSDPSFTGQNADAVPSLYDFLYRRNSPSQGRWISPDPIGKAAVDIANPQTWNRYAYVGNVPLAYVDPYGLCDFSDTFSKDIIDGDYGASEFGFDPTPCIGGPGVANGSKTPALSGAISGSDLSQTVTPKSIQPKPPGTPPADTNCADLQRLSNVEGELSDLYLVAGTIAVGSIVATGGLDAPAAGPVGLGFGLASGTAKGAQWLTKLYANHFGGCNNVLSTD